MSFKVYIPARYASTRLPGKPLAELAGKPIVQHVYERAAESGALEVVIATDDQRIADVAKGFGAQVAMTAPELPSGSDRVAAAATARGEDAHSVIVNLQGDEPDMPATVIRQVADALIEQQVEMSTVCEPLAVEQVTDPNVVKVVRDHQSHALYFSRAPIPYDREHSGNLSELDISSHRRHVGIYAYRLEFLHRFVSWQPTRLEQLEALEQLRALEHGARILVCDACEPCGAGIDTVSDLQRAREARN